MKNYQFVNIKEKKNALTDYKRIEFVIKALSKDEIRYALNYIHAKDGYIEATDGHRIHRATITEAVEPGLYIALKRKYSFYLIPLENTDAKYPNTDSIIGDAKKAKTKSAKFRFTDENELYKAMYELHKLLDAPVNINYIKPLQGIELRVNVIRPDSPVLFENKDLGITSIVMPMRK